MQLSAWAVSHVEVGGREQQPAQTAGAVNNIQEDARHHFQYMSRLGSSQTELVTSEGTDCRMNGSGVLVRHQCRQQTERDYAHNVCRDEGLQTVREDNLQHVVDGLHLN